MAAPENWSDKITSERDVMFGGHTTEQVKVALKEEARRQKKSMSELIHLAVEAMLRARGYDV